MFVDDYGIDSGELDEKTGKPTFKRAAKGQLAYDGRDFEAKPARPDSPEYKSEASRGSRAGVDVVDSGPMETPARPSKKTGFFGRLFGRKAEPAVAEKSTPMKPTDRPASYDDLTHQNRSAERRALVATIARPGVVSGDTRSGASNTKDAVSLLLCGLLREVRS